MKDRSIVVVTVVITVALLTVALVPIVLGFQAVNRSGLRRHEEKLERIALCDQARNVDLCLERER